jgi:4-hydroxybenzoate polyprenyltransferase
MRLYRLLQKKIQTWLSQDLSFSLISIFTTFSLIVALRFIMEQFLFEFHTQSPLTLLLWYLGEWHIFFFVFILSSAILYNILQVQKVQSLILSLFGLLIVLTPPIIDNAIGIIFDRPLWSFYVFDSPANLVLAYFHFFGGDPTMGITYGVRFEVALISLGVLLLGIFIGRGFLRSLMTSIAIYTALFVASSLPSFYSYAQALLMRSYDFSAAGIAGLFLSPTGVLGTNPPTAVMSLQQNLLPWLWWTNALLVLVLWYWWSRSTFMAWWTHTRLPQILYHAGLLCTGALLAVYWGGGSILWATLGTTDVLAFGVLILGVVCAWLSSIAVNDLADTRIDALTNSSRPTVTHALSNQTLQGLGWVFGVLSVLMVASVYPFGALLIAGYHTIATLYSLPPLRLKRYPVVATTLASTASLLILLLGYFVISRDTDLATFPHLLLLYLWVSYATALTIKDFKDIAGDSADSVYTLPVLLGEKWAKLTIGTALFFIFVVSPSMLALPTLVAPSIVAGAAAYSLVTYSRDSAKYFSYRTLAHHFLALVLLYGLVIVYQVFTLQY